jgi:hypothetical protein
MLTFKQPRLFILGGASGIVGTSCYVMAIALPLNIKLAFLLAMIWPILSIIFVFSLFQFINLHKKLVPNYLAFIFACLAFTLLAVMVSSQLGVIAGSQEYIRTSPATEQETLKTLQRSIRLVDMGIDVAWDLFIGTSLIFLSIALKAHPGFGLWWGLPAGLLALLLIILNVITFPWPPDTKNLIDVGPAIGLYIILLSVRLIILGRRMRYSLPAD